jgi:hypothetical protein
MRVLAGAFFLFVYVTMDITVNHGASVHGWVSFLSAMVRSTGLI